MDLTLCFFLQYIFGFKLRTRTPNKLIKITETFISIYICLKGTTLDFANFYNKMGNLSAEKK